MIQKVYLCVHVIPIYMCGPHTTLVLFDASRCQTYIFLTSKIISSFDQRRHNLDGILAKQSFKVEDCASLRPYPFLMDCASFRSC